MQYYLHKKKKRNKRFGFKKLYVWSTHLLIYSSTIYSGLQARIREISLTDFVLCFVLSLHLIASYAVNCYKEANLFFIFFQNIYLFFSASTYHWNLLKVSSTLKHFFETK